MSSFYRQKTDTKTVSLLWGAGGGVTAPPGRQPGLLKGEAEVGPPLSSGIYHPPPPSLPLTKSESSASSPSCQNPKFPSLSIPDSP